ncbi:MAG: hypothetical protein O3C19_05605 [Bacteroidetes bacterium]|nr:hypothetical protein [Bacteroidota bacterium]
MITVYPKYISVKYWAAIVCDDYSTFALPILRDETKWSKWALAVSSTEPFTKAGVPGPFKFNRQNTEELAFKNWEEWARNAYLIMLDYENNSSVKS